MNTLETLQGQYQAKHDRLGLGGRAVPKDHGEGLLGFWNPENEHWEWYRWIEKEGYRMSGSTLFANSSP